MSFLYVGIAHQIVGVLRGPWRLKSVYTSKFLLTAQSLQKHVIIRYCLYNSFDVYSHPGSLFYNQCNSMYPNRIGADLANALVCEYFPSQATRTCTPKPTLRTTRNITNTTTTITYISCLPLPPSKNLRLRRQGTMPTPARKRSGFSTKSGSKSAATSPFYANAPVTSSSPITRCKSTRSF